MNYSIRYILAVARVSLSSRSSVFDVILRVEFWYCRSTEMFIMQALSHSLPDSVGDRNCGALASANRTIRFKLIRVLSVDPNTVRSLIYIMRLSRYLYWISCTTFHMTWVSSAWNRTNIVYERKNFSLKPFFLFERRMTYSKTANVNIFGESGADRIVHIDVGNHCMARSQI